MSEILENNNKNLCDRQKEMQRKNSPNSESDSKSESYKRLEYKGEFYGEFPYFLGVGSWTPSPSLGKEEGLSGFLESTEAAGLVCLLEDAIDELIIIKYIIGAPLVLWDLSYKTLKERYTRRLTPMRIFPQADTKPVLTSAIKLQRDRDSIEVVFYKLTKSLVEDKSYAPLIAALENLRRQEEDDCILIEELKNNLIYLNDLRLRVDQKRKLDEQEEKERGELMYKLQDELDDIILKCEVEEKYVNKWENIRKAQNLWKLGQSENNLKENISKLLVKIKMEKRATHELQTYIKGCQAELEEQLEEWMARYDLEMEKRENKIIHLKYSRDQAEERKHHLHQLYAERNREMKDWVYFRELRKLRTKASLSIQSWWRGIMVRKRLGPYKIKKQKEKGAKAKK